MAQETADFYAGNPPVSHKLYIKFTMRRALYRKYIKTLSPEVKSIVQHLIKKRENLISSVTMAQKTRDFFTGKFSYKDAEYKKMCTPRRIYYERKDELTTAARAVVYR